MECVVGQSVNTLFWCTPRDTLLEYIFLVFNFDKLYVYIINIYQIVERD